MGITFVEKSGGAPTGSRAGAKTALVLAGGAISGGAFKIGGLIAFNTLLQNRDVVDFDCYVGISAGAFLAAPLCAGVTVEELLASIDGKSERIGQFTPYHFYGLNMREYLAKPALLARDAITTFPQIGLSLARQLFGRRRANFIERARAFLRDPTFQTAEGLIQPVMTDLQKSTDMQSPLSYLPSGIFDNRGIERFIRVNLKRNGVPNHFRLLKLERGKDLYIGSTNLNTGEAVVFGHNEDCSVTISEAVQASTAIPGFFRPARINGHDYVDAAVRKTANLSQAVKHGAELIIAYNPFRPFVNYHADQLLYGKRTLTDMGIATVLNQAFRTMLHTRLMLGIEKLRLDNDFHGDVILLEPSETDAKFFNLNPVDFWSRAEAAEHGYTQVKGAIERHHPRIERILARYGIQTDVRALRKPIDEIREARYDRDTILEVLERAQPYRPGRNRTADGMPHLRVVGE